jgi:hypothetical protein
MLISRSGWIKEKNKIHRRGAKGAKEKRKNK